jgi:hypothetical protein
MPKTLEQVLRTHIRRQLRQKVVEHIEAQVALLDAESLRARLARVRKPYRLKSHALAKLKIEVSVRNPRFQYRTGFPYAIWARHVARPLMQVMEDWRAETNKYRPQRVKSLPDLYRVYRWSMAMRGNSTEHLLDLFNQSKSTTQFDVRVLTILFATYITPRWVRPMGIGSAEYDRRRGADDFHRVPMTVYAGDIINCKGRRPVLNHEGFRDQKHRMYSVGFLVLVDSLGFARVIIGGSPGSFNDINMIQRSEFYSEIDK